MGIAERLRQIPDIFSEERKNMANKTSLGVGGFARFYISPQTVYSLKTAIAVAEEEKIPYKAVGNCTNLLVSDKGFNGLVIDLKNINGVMLDCGEIIALCGTPLSRLVAFSVGCCRRGAEGLVGIPATVGGALCQNAGAFGYSASDFVSEVTSLKGGTLIRRDKAHCRFAYRDSVFKNNGEIIVSAKFHFPKRKHGDVRPEEFLKRRQSVQPTGRSCGSVFMNPQGDYAGRLIEQAGLKGYSVGKASVSVKHANFIVTEEGATATDVYRLIDNVKRKVRAEFGVTLKEEVEFLGDF